jgi:hypothetical protein
MIRAKKTRGEKNVNVFEIEKLQNSYGFKQTLYSLVYDKK